jgi:hypothetical protein
MSFEKNSAGFLFAAALSLSAVSLATTAEAQSSRSVCSWNFGQLVCNHQSSQPVPPVNYSIPQPNPAEVFNQTYNAVSGLRQRNLDNQAAEQAAKSAQARAEAATYQAQVDAAYYQAQVDAAKYQAKRDADKRELKQRIGRLTAAGDCDQAKLIALEDGEFELAETVVRLCVKP